LTTFCSELILSFVRWVKEASYMISDDDVVI
jgi:hypothetical protein